MISFGDFLKDKGYQKISEGNEHIKNRKFMFEEEPEEDTFDTEVDDAGLEPGYDEEPEEMDIPEEPAEPQAAKDNTGEIITASSEKELFDALIRDNIEIDDFETFKSREEIKVYYEDRMFNIQLIRQDNNIYQVQLPEDIKITDKNNIEGSVENIKSKLEALNIKVEDSELPDLRMGNRFTAVRRNVKFTMVAKKISPRRFSVHIPIKIAKV